MTSPSHTLRLILGDQLNPTHSWFQTVDPQVVYVLMEVRQETDYVLHHAQKILAIFAAMRDFARHLRAAGHRVRYVALDDPATGNPSRKISRHWCAITTRRNWNGSRPTSGGSTTRCAHGQRSSRS